MVSMSKDARKCSHCGYNGHNSRTCNSKGVGGIKLFGVRIDNNSNSNNNIHDTKLKMLKIEDYESIRKSKSMGNLEHAVSYDHNDGVEVEAGYLSDGSIHSSRHRKKGTSWTEEEHRYFLIGLEKLGKGDWRGISKYYVPSRTSTQVASHAQKYFIRRASIDKKKRRPSVFDLPLKDPNSKSSLSISNKVPEVTKDTSFSLEQLLDTRQIKGQAIKDILNVTCERPPLSQSPINRPFRVPNLHHMPYMVGISRNIQGVTTAKVAPTISWIPVVNFQNQSHIHLRNYSQNPAFVPFVARPTIGASSRPLPQVQSQADHSTPMTNKDVKC